MTAPMNFFDWLYDTHKLQVEAFGIDPKALHDSDFARYVRENTLVAQVELSEFIQEIAWKPWRNDAGRPSPEARTRAVEELADVLHFIANLFVALDVSGRELTRVYQDRQQVNRERMAALAKEASSS